MAGSVGRAGGLAAWSWLVGAGVAYNAALGMALVPISAVLVGVTWSIGLIGGGIAVEQGLGETVWVTVTARTWERAVDVDQRMSVREGAWCEDLPDGATIVSRTTKLATVSSDTDTDSSTSRSRFRRSHRTRTIDRRTTTTKVYKEWCEYSAQVWRRVDTITLSGSTASGGEDAPTWPEVPDDGCDELGCRRPGAQRETYTLVLTVDGARTGVREACVVPASTWTSWSPGQRGTVFVGGLSGQVRCNTLTGPPTATP